MVPAPKSWQQSGLAAKSRGFALLRSLRLAQLAPFLTRSRGKEEVVGTAWPSQLIGGHKKELLWVRYNVQMKSTLWEPLENVDLGSQPLYASFHGGRRQLQIIPLSQRHCPPSYPCSQNQHQLSELAVEVPLDLLGSPHVSNFQEALGRRGVSECPGARKMPPSAQGGKGIESPARVPGYLVPFDGEAPGSGEVGNGAPALSRPPWFRQMPQRGASRSTRSPWISSGTFPPPCSSGSGGKGGTRWVMAKANNVATLPPLPIRRQAPKCYFMPAQRNPLPRQAGSVGDGRLRPKIHDGQKHLQEDLHPFQDPSEGKQLGRGGRVALPAPGWSAPRPPGARRGRAAPGSAGGCRT